MLEGKKHAKKTDGCWKENLTLEGERDAGRKDESWLEVRMLG